MKENSKFLPKNPNNYKNLVSRRATRHSARGAKCKYFSAPPSTRFISKCALDDMNTFLFLFNYFSPGLILFM